MTYDVEFTANAESDLGRLDAKITRRVLKKLAWLADNLHVVGQEALAAPFKGMFKLRCGDYRIVYECNRQERKIVVRIVRHRSQVYKG
ncbi:MAG: type II toxin-antitoxin system RelE/ParE family toxin [Gammaproteobacteria bacterium]|nr:type II toxin-antitoxin system RelE/ParE family toxin [Gammaproteobacteria bacterium]MDE0514685.1 type II toxin-antitoxin system RelE/ParE family toxin [Gammaproteobacteria bacterium]